MVDVVVAVKARLLMALILDVVVVGEVLLTLLPRVAEGWLALAT